MADINDVANKAAKNAGAVLGSVHALWQKAQDNYIHNWHSVKDLGVIEFGFIAGARHFRSTKQFSDLWMGLSPTDPTRRTMDFGSDHGCSRRQVETRPHRR